MRGADVLRRLGWPGFLRDRSRGRLGRRRDRRVGRLPLPPDSEHDHRVLPDERLHRRASCASSTTSTARAAIIGEAMLTWQRNVRWRGAVAVDARLLGERRRPVQRFGVRRARRRTPNVTPTDTSVWALMASRGGDGRRGPAGPRGGAGAQRAERQAGRAAARRSPRTDRADRRPAGPDRRRRARPVRKARRVAVGDPGLNGAAGPARPVDRVGDARRS